MKITVQNLETYFETYGGGKDIILLHGWGADSQIWVSLTQTLVTEYKVTALDLPGFGRTDTPKDTWGVSDYSNFTNEFINSLGMKNVNLIGHSFGGRIAAKLCSNQQNTHTTISSLILINSAGLKANSFKTDGFKVAAKLGKEFFSLPVLKNYAESARQFIYKLAKEEDYLKAGKMQRTFLKVVDENLDKDFKKINQPTLIVWGENDKETPLKQGKEIHKLIPNSDLQIIENAEHFCFLEKPEEVSNEILSWLKEQQHVSQ